MENDAAESNTSCTLICAHNEKMQFASNRIMQIRDPA